MAREASERRIALPRTRSPLVVGNRVAMMLPMRVGLIHMRHARTGGTERYLDQLSTYLAEAGHEPVIVCRSHEQASHEAVRFEVLRPLALGRAQRLMTFARAVERHVAETAYDVVFGLGKTWTHDVTRLGGGLHATYIERAHRATERPIERWVGFSSWKNRAALAIEQRALAPDAVRKVITNSEFVRRDVEARYGVAPETIEVVYNGVDHERFHPGLRSGAGAELRHSLEFQPEDLVLLFLGTGYGRKGLDLVLEAFARVAPERPEARLMVVGYDSRRREFEERARELELDGKTRFLGGRRDAEACYGAADLYTLPTRYDPFANSTLEALAVGLPVITSDANGGSELLTAGVEGSVVSADDATAGARECSITELESAYREWLDPRPPPRGSATRARIGPRARARREDEPHATDPRRARPHLGSVRESLLRFNGPRQPWLGHPLTGPRALLGRPEVGRALPSRCAAAYEKGVTHRPIFCICTLLVAALVSQGCRSQPRTAGTAPLAHESLTAGISRSQHIFGTRPFELRAAGEKMANDIASLIDTSQRNVQVDLIGPHNASSFPLASFRTLSSQLVQTLRAASQRHGIDLRDTPSRALGSGTYELTAHVTGGVRPDGLFFVEWTLSKR